MPGQIRQSKSQLAAEVAALRQRVGELEALQAEHQRAEQVQAALYRIADTANSAENLPDFLTILHQIVSELMDARNFFVAIYDEPGQRLKFPFFIDEVDQDIPPPEAWIPIDRGFEKSLTAYVLRSGQPLLASPEVFAEMVRRGEVEAVGDDSLDWLGVPLKVGSQTLGVLVVQSYIESVRYTERDRDLLMFVSQHIATAIQRVRQLGEVREHMAELAVINSLGQTLTTQLKLSAVIDLVGEKIREVFKAQVIFIALYDPQTNLIHFPYFLVREQRVVTHYLTLGQGLTSIVVKGRQPLIINQDFERVAAELGAYQVAETLPKSWLGVPILVGGEVRGVISLQHMERENMFGEADVRLLTMMGASMWVAIENARLFESIEQRVEERTAELGNKVEQLDLITHVSRYASLLRNQETLLPTIVDLIRAAFDYYVVMIVLVDPEAREIYPAAVATVEKEFEVMQSMRFPLDPPRGLVGYTVAGGEPLMVNDVSQEPRYHPVETLPLTRSELTLPLRVGSEVLGVLDLESTALNAFSADDVQVLRILADQLAIAIHNDKLFAAAQEARAEAETANRLKSQFLANMSHELRTPLNSIINFAYLLSVGTEGEVTPGQEDLLNRIGESGRHLLGLINDILDLAKIEAGRLELYLEPVDLFEIVDSVVSTAAGLLRDKPVKLVVDVQDPLPLLRADRTRLRQVLLNLLSNAAKFTAEGQIQLRAWAQDAEPWVTISVADTGIGMAPEDIPKAFAEFVQLEGGPSRQAGGTGLGLPITKRFVEMHGGAIWAESQLGAGTTFFFTMPVFDPASLRSGPAPEAPVEPAPEAEVNAAPAEARVLVVDDDNDARETIVRQLTAAHQYQVIKLSDSRLAVDKAKEVHPDVVLLDLLMPHQDGWEILKALKADPETKAIPVIICSVLHEQRLALSLQANDYLIKPVGRDELLQTLKRFAAPGSKVLAIDDDPNALEIMRRLLGGLFYQVSTASDGAAGLAALEVQMPDVLVLDLMMPGLSGFEVLARLRADPKTQNLPVVVVTAKDLTPAERAQLQSEAAALLQKGLFSPAELEQVIQQAVLRGAGKSQA
jgi:signal transduction histidine kinase/CheY-like chemotaxis protein